ncbi:SPOR domain-containing protein [Sinobacterium caligoides]|uniref:SPOR domain-containing protein n=1 Tax=Sinobacterium caligoides TaxID=933926 RepID=UPI0013C2D7CE|nr:SPOR domain-containing protein [Sinobacterium caligoides]
MNRRTPIEKASTPIWVWLLTAVLLLGLLAFLAHLLTQAPASGTTVKPTKSSSQAKQERPIPVVNKSKPAVKADGKIDYEFYRILKESEVKVDVVPLDMQPRKEYIYFIQAGSFRSHADADSHRANLILQGLKAHIEGPSKNGWYRVLVGPYERHAGRFSKERAALVNQGFDTMTIKRDKPKK